MVLELILMGVAIPTVFATTEAIKSNQNEAKESARARTFRLLASTSPRARHRAEVDGKIVALLDGKLYLVPQEVLTGPKSGGHPFLGHYRAFPNMNFLGLVSTIQDEPPMLNWIYIDKTTLEVRYGSRAEALDNVVGPFDWTKDRSSLIMDGWEGFVAVEEKKGVWALYFDIEDDGSRLPKGKKVVEISLVRRKHT